MRIKNNSLKLKKIDLSRQEHPDISSKKTYLVNYDGQFIIGQFNNDWWLGWYFTWFESNHGIQLNSLEEVWEILN